MLYLPEYILMQITVDGEVIWLVPVSGAVSESKGDPEIA